jgi:hypothetical protein
MGSADEPSGPETLLPRPAGAEAETLRRLDFELTGVAPPMYVDGDLEPAWTPMTRSHLGSAWRTLLGWRLSRSAWRPRCSHRCATRNWPPERQVATRRLLLYGPPKWGKAFIAKRPPVSSARFLAVSLADVLDMFIGQSLGIPAW